MKNARLEWIVARVISYLFVMFLMVASFIVILMLLVHLSAGIGLFFWEWVVIGAGVAAYFMFRGVVTWALKNGN